MSEKFKVFISKFKQHFQKKNFLMMAAAVLFIAASVSVPVHQARAQGLVGMVGNLVACMGDPISCGMNAFIVGLSMAGSALLGFIYAVLIAVLGIGLELSSILVVFGAWLIDAMLDPRLYVGDPAAAPPVPGVLTSSTITTGWTTVRDMCNTFYVFFLLIIAFGTILRSSTFNAKNLLPKLIISLFLINFSAVIAKLVIDFGQVFMYGIMSWMGTFQSGGGSLTSIVDQFKNVINAPGQSTNFDQVVRAAFALAYSVVLGIVYIMLALFLLIRLVAFVILIILSPIAFLSITMPSLGKYTSEWWGELVKYSLFGPIFMFFVYLSATMANELVTNFTPLTVTGTALNPITGIISIMVPHAVALMMLLAVVPVTQKFGGGAANKIIGGTAGLGKIVMGGYAGAKLAGRFGKKVASEADRRTGGKASDWGRRQKEKILLNIPGGFGRGTVLKGRAETEKAKDENMKKIRVEFGEAKNRDLDEYQRKANGGLATNEDKVLFAETAAAQGKLGDAKYAGDIKKFMPTIEITLSKKELEEGITNKNLSLSLETSEGKKKIDDYRGKINSKTGANYTLEEAKEETMKEKMADIIRDGKAHEVQGLDKAVDSKIWHYSQDSEQRKSSVNRMPEDQRRDLAKGYMANTIGYDPINPDNPAAVVAYSAANDEEKKKDMKFRTNAAKLSGDLEGSFKRGGVVVKEEIEQAFSQLSVKDISRMSDKDVEKYAYSATNSQSRNLNRAGEYEAVDLVRKSKETRKAQIAMHPFWLADPSQIAEHKKMQDEIDHIDSLINKA